MYVVGIYLMLSSFLKEVSIGVCEITETLDLHRLFRLVTEYVLCGHLSDGCSQRLSINEWDIYLFRHKL